MNPTQHPQIEAYLRGELSPEQLKDFNNLLANDPSFAQNVRFEEKIVEGLSEVRKAELKSRLDAIDVAPTGWMGIGQIGNSALVKTLGGIAVVSLVGTLVYTNLDSEQVSAIDEDKVITTDINYPVEQEVINLQLNLIEESAASTEDIQEQYAQQSEPESITEELEEATQSVVTNTKTPDEFDLTVNVPQPGDLDKEEGLVTPDSNLPEISTTDEVANKEVTPVDVETVNRKNETLKFKYFDGKLFLYGDFNEQPYEIIEINGAKERKLYLFFENKYFSIDITDKVKELNEIENPKLINELNIIRNNK